MPNNLAATPDDILPSSYSLTRESVLISCSNSLFPILRDNARDSGKDTAICAPMISTIYCLIYDEKQGISLLLLKCLQYTFPYIVNVFDFGNPAGFDISDSFFY